MSEKKYLVITNNKKMFIVSVLRKHLFGTHDVWSVYLDNPVDSQKIVVGLDSGISFKDLCIKKVNIKDFVGKSIIYAQNNGQVNFDSNSISNNIIPACSKTEKVHYYYELDGPHS